jgi:putative nucleotidyltransferase with HDIG domain
LLEFSDIEKCFSDELALIKNKDLQVKVVKVWQEAANRGKWQKLDDIPFTLLIKKSGRLTDHTKRITRLAKSVFDNRDENINLDYLIAGALLHDVGKLMEYEMSNGQVIKSEFGKKMRHPVSGSKLAEEYSLPNEIVHIIFAHSKEGDTIKRSLEAIIVNHCDFIDFEIKKTLV